ncbi:MAG: HAD family hydrolase [Actinobacteria bacterium]|nr:HAD family hydrolase [Actinomycetota bacterium]
MLKVSIPGFGDLEIGYLVLDLNGTLTTDGALEEEVCFLIELLRNTYNIDVYIVTAGTRRNYEEIAEKISAQIVIVSGNEAREKANFILKLGSDKVCAIGNGANDVAMLESAALSICVIGNEGASPQAIIHSDVVVKDIKDALRMLIHPKRLIATLRR